MILNYSPQSCDPELLLRCTVGASRLRLLDTMTDAVRHEIGKPTHQHQIVIGARGSGKTHVLSLFVHRMKTDAVLGRKTIPVQMPEELAVGQPADLLAKIVSRLADILERDLAFADAGATALSVLCRTRLDRIRSLHDDKEALLMAFDSLDEIATKTGRLIVAIVENFDSLLYSGAGRSRADSETPQWALRKEFQARAGILLVASAPTAFGEIHDSGAPFHDFLREHAIDELSLDEMVNMIRARLDVELGNLHLDDRTRRRLQSLKVDLPHREPALRGVLTLAGGLPRFGHLLFDVVVETEIASSFQVLSRFLDEQTPYFQGWLNPRLVPERELTVLDFLATSEGPLTPTQISRDLRGFPVNAVAMCLKRLQERHLVRRRTDGPKEVRYDVAEPLLRVWRRFRTGRGEQDRLLLIAEFVAALYEPTELLAERHILAQSSPETPRLRLLDFALQHCARLSPETLVAQETASTDVRTPADQLVSSTEEEFLRGNLRKAVLAMKHAVSAIEKSGDQNKLAKALGRLSHMTLLSGDCEEALRAALRGEKIAMDGKYDLSLANCIRSRGNVLFRLGENDAARQAYDAAETLHQKVGDDLGRANCIRSRGDVLFRLGENDAARQAYDAAETLYQKVGSDLGRANCISDRGRARARLGQWEPGLTDVLNGLVLTERVDAKFNIPLIANDYLAILEQNLPDTALPRLTELLSRMPELTTKLATYSNVRSAFTRLALTVVHRFPIETAQRTIRELVAFLPDTHSELLKPALLVTRIRSGELSSDLPAEPEEIRRVVRMALDRVRKNETGKETHS